MIKIFVWIFKKIASFFSSKVGKGVLAGAAVAGVGAGAVGAAKHGEAKKKNNKALALKEAAIKRHDQEREHTQLTLLKLGEAKTKAIQSFVPFCDLLEQIQGRPEFKEIDIRRIDLPSISQNQLKVLSQDLEFAVKGAGGMVAGVGIGLAFCGLNVFALGPGALVGGVVLCADGIKLSKKAADNLKQAQQLEKDVERIVEYYATLSEASENLQNALLQTYILFQEHIKQVNALIHTKSDWRLFSKKERKLIENAVLICKMLYKMCAVELVTKKDEVEEVNTRLLENTIKDSNRLTAQINKKGLLGSSTF